MNGTAHEPESVSTRIERMLAACASERPSFPPTELFNEGWMLRLMLDWFATQGDAFHPLGMEEGTRWYSEVLLPSAFLPRYRGDRFGESYTHADGVIGQFSVGVKGVGDLVLLPQATRFVVIEAKMFSRLSPGVTHARYYNQAARTVACMAEVLRRAGLAPASFERLSFLVTAPREMIDAGVYRTRLKTKSIEKTIRRRVTEYDGDKEPWMRDWLQPTLEHLATGTLSWEALLDHISGRDPATGESLALFYANCLKFNRRNRKAE